MIFCCAGAASFACVGSDGCGCGYVVMVVVVVVVVVVSIWYFLAPAEEHMTLRSALCRSRCDGGGGGGGERPQQLIKPKSLSVSQTIASCQLPFFYFLVCYMLQDGK